MVFCPRDLATSAPAAPLVEWDETNCPLCDGGQSALVVEAADPTPNGGGLRFAVVRCHDCGLCFTNPRPSSAAIGRFYPSSYEPHRPPSLRERSRWWRRDRRVLPLHGQGRLLDFGCGSGGFLERMCRQGWNVTGVDVSETAVARAQVGAGVHVLAGSLPHPALSETTFDAITMWHSLEHVHEPLKVLRAAQRLLVHGGQLIVAVPNIDSAAFRWFGPAWAGLDLPRHLVHFSPLTLRLMVERAGFEVGLVRMVRHSSWLRLSARRACEGPLASSWHRWLQAKPPSRLATWYSYLTGQCDCIAVTAVKRAG